MYAAFACTSLLTLLLSIGAGGLRCCAIAATRGSQQLSNDGLQRGRAAAAVATFKHRAAFLSSAAQGWVQWNAAQEWHLSIGWDRKGSGRLLASDGMALPDERWRLIQRTRAELTAKRQSWVLQGSKQALPADRPPCSQAGRTCMSAAMRAAPPPLAWKTDVSATTPAPLLLAPPSAAAPPLLAAPAPAAAPAAVRTASVTSSPLGP